MHILKAHIATIVQVVCNCRDGKAIPAREILLCVAASSLLKNQFILCQSWCIMTQYSRRSRTSETSKPILER